MIIEKSLLEKVFPAELVEYFAITDYQELCSVQDKLEYHYCPTKNKKKYS